MAYDRFIYFPSGKGMPGTAELRMVLEDYLGEAGRVEWTGDRLYAILQGPVSFPFKRLPETPEIQVKAWEDRAVEADGKPRIRWFEIYAGENNIDVITREMDEYANNVASGFAELCARFWNGKLER